MTQVAIRDSLKVTFLLVFASVSLPDCLFVLFARFAHFRVLWLSIHTCTMNVTGQVLDTHSLGVLILASGFVFGDALLGLQSLFYFLPFYLRL